MKRIVVCPSCNIKMQIFDIGKEINQKCPRCQNSFDIHPAKPEGKDKGKSAGTKEQPKAESAPVTEAPKDEPTKVAETAAPTDIKEAPKSEPPEVKEAPKSTDQPSEKKIMVKPPTAAALKTAPAADEKPADVATGADEKSGDKKPADEKPADEKPADEAKSGNGAKSAKAGTKPTGFVNKSATASKPGPTALPASEPRVEPPLAGFSKLQFMILFVLLLIAIIFQVVFAKYQMKQISVINDNIKIIHSKL